MKDFAEIHGWVWPTETQTETVQHVLHSPDIALNVRLDCAVRHSKGKRDRLSDHPFVVVDVE